MFAVYNVIVARQKNNTVSARDSIRYLSTFMHEEHLVAWKLNKKIKKWW